MNDALFSSSSRPASPRSKPNGERILVHPPIISRSTALWTLALAVGITAFVYLIVVPSMDRDFGRDAERNKTMAPNGEPISPGVE